MMEEDLFEQEIQKKKRRVLVLLVCLFVLAGGGFVARKTSPAETEGAATPAQVADAGAQPAPAETPAGGEPEISEENDSQTSGVEDGASEQAGEDTIAEADGIGGSEEAPGDRVAEEETVDNDGTVTRDVEEPVAGDVESKTGSSDDGGADKSVVDDEDNGESQAGGEIGAESNSGDGVTSDGTDTSSDKESTPDLDDISDVDATDSDDNQTHDGIGDVTGTGVEISDSSTTGGTTDELDSEDKTTTEQPSDQEQTTDFQPPPPQLPVTGGAIVNWGAAPIMAISLMILLVGAGASSLYSSKHRRY